MELTTEEQTLPRFGEKQYYPVKPGQLFDNRYQIITKLGYGAYSTAWLARDHRTGDYRTLKVCIRGTEDDSPVSNELKILKRLGQSDQEHPGSAYVRTADDIIDIEGPHGNHHCIVMKPQGCSLWTLQHMFPGGRVPKEIVRDFVHRMIGCVNWLHADCEVIHTEITTQNVLAGLRDNSLFQRLEEEESKDPSVASTEDGYPIYHSRGQPMSILDLSGDAVLTDFGSARLVDAGNKGWWMADTYRAPEILLGLPWDHEVDLWSIGFLALELLEGRNLFEPIDTVHKQYVLPLALAQYIGYLGPPPQWMIEKSGNPIIKAFFNDKGEWNSEPQIPPTSLEGFVTAIPPGEEKTKFMAFIRRMLTWDPAARAPSHELFMDEWLTTPDQYS